MSRSDPQRAAELISDARADAEVTQVELAERAGASQSNLATMESGRRKSSPAMLERILAAADYRPSVAAAAARVGLSAPRVFGSIVRGEDHLDSDIDLVVQVTVGAGLIPIAAFAAEVERSAYASA